MSHMTDSYVKQQKAKDLFNSLRKTKLITTNSFLNFHLSQGLK